MQVSVGSTACKSRYARTRAHFSALSLTLSILSVPVAGVYLFICTSLRSPSATCIKRTVALSTWQGPNLKWWAPPIATFYFPPRSMRDSFFTGQYTNGNQAISIKLSAGEGFHCKNRKATQLKSRVHRNKEMWAVLGGYMNNGPIILLCYLVCCCWFRIMGLAVVLLHPFTLNNVMAVWLNARVLFFLRVLCVNSGQWQEGLWYTFC